MNSNTLSVQGMLPYLSPDIPKKLIIISSLESTNKTAKEMLTSGTEHGTVIIANHQTAGKGRYGRAFHSPPGHGLYMSLILHSNRIACSTTTLITASAAVSVCEAIETVSQKSPWIKWVNDIFLDEKKICGILTEAVTDPKNHKSQWIIVGIGINYTTPASEFPEELQKTAGSLYETQKPAVTRNQLAAEIINRIVIAENQYSEKEMLLKYKQKMLMLGKPILVTETTGTPKPAPYKATAMDIDETGRLIIKKTNGEIQSLSAGEISVKQQCVHK